MDLCIVYIGHKATETEKVREGEARLEIVGQLDTRCPGYVCVFAGMFKKEKEEYLKKKKVISHELAIFPAEQFVVSCM